jgi:hypothetical protein
MFLKLHYIFLQTLCNFFKLLPHSVRLKDCKTINLQKDRFETLLLCRAREGINPPSNTCNGERVYKQASTKRTIRHYKYGVIQQE